MKRASYNSGQNDGYDYRKGPQNKEESWDRLLLLFVLQVCNVYRPSVEQTSLYVLNLDNAGQLTWVCGGPEDKHGMTNTPPSPDYNAGLHKSA